MEAEIDVEFDSPDRMYTEGELIRLKILVTPTKTIQTSCILARCLGYCATKWFNEELVRNVDGGEFVERKVTYTGHEEYFRHYREVIGTKDGPEIEISPVQNEYIFHFRLPVGLPSSLEHKYGFIRYEIKISIDKHPHLACKASFKVKSPLKLNLYPELREPLKIGASEKFSACCYKSKPIFLILRLPHAGFTLSEPICMEIKCSNSSNRDVKEIRVKLKHWLIFNASSPVQEVIGEEREIIGKSFLGPKAGKQKLFNTTLQLPSATDLTNLNFSHLIESRYFVDVKAKVGTNDENLKIRLPITIGNEGFSEKEGSKSVTAPLLEKNPYIQKFEEYSEEDCEEIVSSRDRRKNLTRWEIGWTMIT